MHTSKRRLFVMQKNGTVRRKNWVLWWNTRRSANWRQIDCFRSSRAQCKTQFLFESIIGLL